MWLAFYNTTGIGDVLLLTSGQLEDDFAEVESNENVTVIKDKRTHHIVSVNIFNVSDFGIEGNGQVTLSELAQDKLNERIKQAGFDVAIQVDNTTKFVVGYVETCEDHPDSDHLHTTFINVGEANSLQIVCGASNIEAGQHVIVAKPGAVMPSGAIIWPGELRGVKSNGMVCSTRELGLADLEDKPGIWVVDSQFKPGTPLNTVVQYYKK